MNVHKYLFLKCIFCSVLAAGANAVGAQSALANNAGREPGKFPTKPIRLLVSGVGGAGDFAGRLLAADLTQRLGQQVVVDNRPGGVTPGEILAKAQPDGYTLMMVGFVIWLSPFMRDHVPFDPVRDFAPVSLAISSPNVLVVHPSLRVKSVTELIALAKQKPGALNYATSGVGNSNHIAGELFRSMAGVELVRVNYRGASLALTDVVSGRVELMFATANASQPHVSAGRLIALGVTSAQPSPVAPGLPAVAAAGLPGYESAATIGVLARAGTPPAVVNVLHREIARYMRTPEAKERLLKAGIEAVGNTPAEFAAIIRDDMRIKGKIIREAGIRMD
jgi:tripartite-type tricarboxylate transporter receptor subunit TctC